MATEGATQAAPFAMEQAQQLMIEMAAKITQLEQQLQGPAVAALGIRRIVEAYSKGGLLTNDQPKAQRKLL
jgi:hypothetical protein